MPEKYIFLGNVARKTQKTCTIADSLDPDLSNHILSVSVHTLNIPCLITAKDFSQIIQAFIEYSNRLSSPPVIFIAGRPKAALLLWFFGDFRCGALLFVVIHVIYVLRKVGIGTVPELSCAK